MGPIFAGGERHAGLMYEVTIPSGRKVTPPKGSHWRMVENEFWKMVDDGRILFGEKGDNSPAIKLFLNEVQGGMVPRTWWPHTEVGHSQEAKREIQKLFPGDLPFDTPKPERLIERIIRISTNIGDLVLDSFAGSGTTGAVAHKLKRKWLMVELGSHCNNVILPRLEKVINGEDEGGITKALEWKGGGGFRYYKLAPSLLEKDHWDNWVISKQYNASMLAEAVCNLEGFSYEPSETHYWQHGHSTEQDYLYTTTANLKHAQLQQLSEEVGPERTLLIVCSSFRGSKNGYENLTIKKIPSSVLDKCEWGKDDYSLNVENLPSAPAPEGQQQMEL